jgi:putative transposase
MKSIADHKNEVASNRVQLILPLISKTLTNKDRIVLQKEIAKQSGLSYRTLSRYRQKYLDQGFEALKPQTIDTKEEKVIAEDILKEAIKLRVQNPHRSITDIIRIMEMNEIVEQGSIARSTLQKALQEVGYSKAQLKKYSKSEENGAIGRFQKEHRMEMWQGDIKYGPYLPLGPNGELKQVYFIGWIDDCSRMIMSGRFYVSMTADDVCNSFYDALVAYGKPDRIYVDNGKQYVSERLTLACSQLGIKKSHAPVRRGAAKGKIEAYNHILNKFISELYVPGEQGKYTSIESVNEAYISWQEEYYHNFQHSSLNLATPRETFFADTRDLVYCSAYQLEEAFKLVCERRVDNASCVSIDGDKYQVEDNAHIGSKVTLVSTANPSEFIVKREGFEDCFARPVTISSYVDFEKRAKSTKLEVVEVPSDGSSLISAVIKRHKASNPNSTIHEKAEIARKEMNEQKNKTKIDTLINYSALLKDKQYE